MDRWDSHRSLAAEDQDRRRNRRENPSFSSTLLDAIYRSIDEGTGGNSGAEGELIFYTEETMRKKKQSGGDDDNEMVDFRRACMIEKWMEKKKVTDKVVVRRNSVHNHDFMLLNSSSTSSDSSCGGGFSSSESESKSRSSSSCSSYTTTTTLMQQQQQRPPIKPIRTSVSGCTSDNPEFEKYGRSYHHHHHHDRSNNNNNNSAPKQKQKHENGFVKTKSKALKIYGDLKKVKQPISPGGRLASFLNSLFNAGNTKKPPKKKIHDDLLSSSQIKSKSANTSTTCSSASSFSRSCLSKTPSSRGTKRSVRFCPVSVIVDEDCRPCGHKNLHEDHERQQQQQQQVDYNRRRVQEVARDLLKSYQKKNDNVQVVELDMRDVIHHNDNVELYDNENDDDEDDDAASYSSSDLFELDNLSAIGIERYSEELPVYETTHFDTNRAIANGLIL